MSGELAGARTQDPRLKRAMLYQLSYELVHKPLFQNYHRDVFSALWRDGAREICSVAENSYPGRPGERAENRESVSAPLN